MDERALLSLLGALDEGALGLVYDTFQQPLYCYAYRLLGHPEAAEDIVADTFQRLLDALHRGKGPKRHLKAWLYRVAHNLIADRYRRQPPLPLLSLEETLPQEEDSLAEKVHLRLEQERVRQALHELTPDQRQVLVLKFLQGLDNKEVALVLKKPVGAVKSLQHRGLAALRRFLEESQPDPQEGAP